MKFFTGENMRKTVANACHLYSTLLLFCLGTAVPLASLPTSSHAFLVVTKSIPSLADDIVRNLAKLGKNKGSREVARELTEYAAKVPAAQRVKFLEAAYAKILVEQKRVPIHQADEWLKNLSGTPGFEKTLSKMVGASEEKFVGHAYELSTANALARNNFKIVEIGQSYKIKEGLTDIDIVASKGNKTFAIECKNFDARKMSYEEINSFIGDMEVLMNHAKELGSVPVLLVKNKPYDPTIANLLLAHAKKRQIKLVYGSSEAVSQVLGSLK